MAVIFTYGGTTFTASRDPNIGNFTTTRMWKAAVMLSGGGSMFVKDKEIKKDIVTLTWMPIDQTDLTNLLAFLVVVNGSGANFTFTDPLGSSKTAMFWGPNLLKWTPADIMETEFSIQLLIVAEYKYLTDESGNYITDESGNKILITC